MHIREFHVLDDYLKHHRKRGQEYLLARNNSAFDKKDIMNIMRDVIGKNFTYGWVFDE